MGMPRHPDQDDEPASGGDAPNTKTKVVVAAVVALIVAMVALHLVAFSARKPPGGPTTC